MCRTETKRKILSSILISAAITLLFCSRYTIVCVSGSSMRPALESGSMVIVDKWRSPHNGDIVVAYSEEVGGKIIKRIVAEGGSVVAMKAGHLIRDREYIQEDYLLQENMDREETWGEQEVPLGTYFLMGDNRGSSVDSRYFGSVAEDAIKGTVVFTLFQ